MLKNIKKCNIFPPIRFKEFTDSWQPEKLKNILIERKEKNKITNQYETVSVTTKGLIPQNQRFKKPVSNKNMSIGYHIIHPQDIVIVPYEIWLGSINFNVQQQKFIVSPSYYVYYVDNHLNPFFIFKLLMTHQALQKYQSISYQGSSNRRKNLDKEAFNHLDFDIPSFQEQNKIATVLSLIDERINLEQQLLYYYQLQRQYLLNNMIL